MTETFLKAFHFTMENEGGYVEDSNDPGGATNLGISQAFLKQVYAKGMKEVDFNNDGIIDRRDIKDVEKYGLVQMLYKEEFWEKVKDIPDEDLAIKVFDASVNIGPKKAIKILQGVVNTTPDGIIGPMTIKAINKFNPSQLLKSFIDGLKLYYYQLCFKNRKLDKFLKGWIRRAERLPNLRS